MHGITIMIASVDGGILMTSPLLCYAVLVKILTNGMKIVQIAKAQMLEVMIASGIIPTGHHVETGILIILQLPKTVALVMVVMDLALILNLHQMPEVMIAIGTGPTKIHVGMDTGILMTLLLHYAVLVRNDELSS